MELYKNKVWKEVFLNNELKNIPMDWEVSKVINKLNEFKPSKMNASEGKKSGLYPFFNASKNQTLFSNNYLVDDEAVIITTGGDYAFSQYFAGKFAYSSHVWSFKMKEDDNKFFTYLFKYFFETIQNLSVKGFKLKNLNKKDFKNIDFYFPPLKEQKNIANLLSSQEKVIEKTKELIKNIDKRNQFMIDELLSGRLRVKEAENGKIIFYKNEEWKAETVNGEDIEIPKNWDIKGLSTLIESNMGETILSGNIKKSPFPDSIPVVSASQDEKYFGYIDKKLVKKPLKKGEMTICARGSIGFPRIVKEAVASTQTTIQIRSNSLNLNYLYYYLNINHNKFFNATGGAVPQLTLSMINLFNIIEPQNKDEINELLKIIEKLISEKEKYEQILKEEEKKFNFLLEELMSGRLRIKN